MADDPELQLLLEKMNTSLRLYRAANRKLKAEIKRAREDGKGFFDQEPRFALLIRTHYIGLLDVIGQVNRALERRAR